MYEVFKNAYCTIAATSATNSDEGFLKGAVIAPNPESWKKNFATEFKSSVESGVLNKRAWVLQERVLSPRIIHFTEEQIFWECGQGVCWGTVGYMNK